MSERVGRNLAEDGKFLGFSWNITDLIKISGIGQGNDLRLHLI